MGWPLGAQTISLIKKEGFKPTFKHRNGVWPTDYKWELVSENRGMVAEGSASQITFRDLWNYQ